MKPYPTYGFDLTPGFNEHGKADSVVLLDDTGHDVAFLTTREARALAVDLIVFAARVDAGEFHADAPLFNQARLHALNIGGAE